MTNFGFNQDPLLFHSIIPSQNGNMSDENNLRNQYDAVITQYQALQQKIPQPQTRDYLGELDTLTREIDSDIAEKLNSNSEYTKINGELQYLIQEEMLRSVRWKINNNPEAVSRIDKMKEIINNAKREKNDENNRNLMELNDYIKNYSDLTFDEYKRLKNNK